MSGEYLLDSNIVIDVFRGNQEAIARISQIENIYLPVIVLGELYFGANKSNQLQRRFAEIERLMEVVSVLNITPSTAKVYGIIKEQLRAKGRPIPENDIWIAAIAIENDMILLTRDEHFDYVDGIRLS